MNDFTYSYSQPSEYQFSLDSVLLAKEVASLVQDVNLKNWTTLDLCSGCGVVGFDLCFHLPHLSHISFLEIQSDYQSHFLKNLDMVKSQRQEAIQAEFLLMNYSELTSKIWQNRFDLIVSNPPYFQIGQGKLSPSEFKNRCRFFIDSDLETFLLAMYNTLKPNSDNPNSAGYFLLRNLMDHKINQFENIQNDFKRKGLNVDLEKVADIRGTDLIRLKKPF